MLGHDGMDAKTKMESLMELIKEMRSMHGESAKGEPKAMEVEIHEMKALPKGLEHETPESELEESPEHESMESPEMETAEHEEMPEAPMEEESEEEQSPMSLPPGLLKLLAEHMKK